MNLRDLFKFPDEDEKTKYNFILSIARISVLIIILIIGYKVGVHFSEKIEEVQNEKQFPDLSDFNESPLEINSRESEKLNFFEETRNIS